MGAMVQRQNKTKQNRPSSRSRPVGNTPPFRVTPRCYRVPETRVLGGTRYHSRGHFYHRYSYHGTRVSRSTVGTYPDRHA
eukprot:3327158-Rhodomonas_salina.1